MIITFQSRNSFFEYRIEDLDGRVLETFEDLDEAKLRLRNLRCVLLGPTTANAALRRSKQTKPTQSPVPVAG